MDRTVRGVARRSLAAGGRASLFFGGVAARAAGLVAVSSPRSAKVAAVGSRGAHQGMRLRPFGSAVVSDGVVCSLPAQQGVQAEPASQVGLT